MEIAAIKPNHDFDFPFNSSSYSKNFLIPPASNGINNNCISALQFQVSDIEMIAFQAAAYTSLKDLLPTSSSIISPTNSRKDSWREIPIKDPLLQHAAWAYLQPMAVDPETDGRSFIDKFKDHCCGVFGCFSEVVVVMVKSWFLGIKEEDDKC